MPLRITLVVQPMLTIPPIPMYLREYLLLELLLLMSSSHIVTLSTDDGRGNGCAVAMSIIELVV